MGGLRALPLMMSLLLLTGCGGRGEVSSEALAMDIRREFSAMTGCSFQAALSADYETRVFDYVLDVTWDRETGATLTIVEPELARGVSAHIQNGKSELIYDDFSLDAGPLTEDGLSPLETLPAFWQAITQGCIAAASGEGERLQVTYRDGALAPGVGMETGVVFDARSHAPLSGELFYDGVRIATVTVRDFQSLIPVQRETAGPPA